MGLALPERQKWLEHALQGLAFWIGHRHSLFQGYPLTEGALVAEACNLIQANLPHELVLLPECMYSNLVAPGTAIAGVAGLARADLVLCHEAAKDIGRDGNIAAHTRFVIEVKRGDSSARLIDEDLRRLHAYLRVAAERFSQAKPMDWGRSLGPGARRPARLSVAASITVSARC
jgi:hypothetical protein